MAMDMTEGIIARFRTMAIFRPSILTGQVLASVIQAMIGVTIVTGVAVLVGFRSQASALEWLAALGLLTLLALALIWLCTALGLKSKTVETASNAPMPLILLPFLGSAFVPTDSMPTGLRWFAEYQPFTLAIEAVRALLSGTPVGSNGPLAVAWCAAIAAAGYLWSIRLFNESS